MRSLQDKVVAVTGGARGIDAATASALAAAGTRVAIGDLDEAAAQPVVRHGHDVHRPRPRRAGVVRGADERRVLTGVREGRSAA